MPDWRIDAAGLAKHGLYALLAVLAGVAAAGSLATAQEPQTGVNMTLPHADSKNGRLLFARKGCVGCHAINGVGGSNAAPLDAATMDPGGNVFEFLARLWVGIDPMIDMQEQRMGQQIELSAQEWADIVAFVHDAEEQKTFAAGEIPPEITRLMESD